ncbi:hypothetical protein U1499_05855 [Aeromonas caviae]|uniref:hypothetical protein n=1 Tax=Aeromonas caviae TaxID=648 RepID=UPI0030152819
MLSTNNNNSHSIQYTFYLNKFASKNANTNHHIVKPISHHHATWGELVDLVMNKDEWPTFHADTVEEYNQYKDKFDGIVFAEMREGESRTAENVVRFHGIILDIDDGTSYEAVEKDLRDYEYCLYSTGSSGLKSGDRFRVLLPLKTPISSSDWSLHSASLLSRFPYSDACFGKSIQIMYSPRLNTAKREYFKAKHNQGVLFDWSNNEHLPFVDTSVESFTSEVTFSTPVFEDSEFQELATLLSEHNAGSLDYEQRRIMANRLVSIGMDFFTARNVLDACTRAGASQKNDKLLQTANPNYGHAAGLYKMIPKGSRIPALDRCVVGHVTNDEIDRGSVEKTTYDGEWWLDPDTYKTDPNGSRVKQSGGYVSDLIKKLYMNQNDKFVLWHFDTGAGKNHLAQSIGVVATPLRCIVDADSEYNSLIDGNFIGTYDQAKAILNEPDKSKFKDKILFVDEAHNLVSAHGYRSKAIQQLFACFKYFKNVVFMSGTVTEDMFSDITFDRKYRVHKPTFAPKILNYNVCHNPVATALKAIHKTKNKSIVFVNDRSQVDTIVGLLGSKAIGIHSENKNSKQVQGFLKSKSMAGYQYLIGTNSIAEGLSLTDTQEEVDVFIIDEVSPSLIEQVQARFRSVSGKRNIHLYIQRMQAVSIDAFNRDKVIVEQEIIVNKLNEINALLHEKQSIKNFTRRFSKELSDDFIYLSNDGFKVNQLAIDHAYYEYQQESYRDDFKGFCAQMQGYGFTVHMPVFHNDTDDLGHAELVKANKEVAKKERERELNELLIKMNENALDNLTERQERVLLSINKLTAKGLSAGQEKAVIEGVIASADDTNFFARAHQDHERLVNGCPTTSLLTSLIGEKREFTGQELRDLAVCVANQVLVDYFMGDVNRMMVSNSWGHLVTGVACGNNSIVNSLYNSNSVVTVQISTKNQTPIRILESYLLLGKSKTKSTNGIKTRITPLLAFSQTGLKWGLPLEQPRAASVLEERLIDLRAKTASLITVPNETKPTAQQLAARLVAIKTAKDNHQPQQERCTSHRPRGQRNTELHDKVNKLLNQ